MFYYILQVFIPHKDNADFQAILDEVILEYQKLHELEDQDVAAERKVSIFLCLKQ